MISMYDPNSSSAMSIVLVTPDYFETIRATIAHLERQTLRDRLEIIIVTPMARDFGMPESIRLNFGDVRIVSIPSFDETGNARAVGVSVATTPIIAFAEDHSFPEPGWAEALLQAHRLPRAAVAPAFVNANPETALSWANIFLSFAPWLAPVESGVMPGLPWHNTSYRRDLLLAYGNRLGELLNPEGFLQADLRANGYVLYLEASARTHHQNITAPKSFVIEQFYAGRLFASRRIKYDRWSVLRKLGYAIFAPLIMFMRIWRLRRHIQRTGKRHLVLAMLPWFLLGSLCYTTGETVGYFLGAGNSLARHAELEHHRERHLA